MAKKNVNAAVPDALLTEFNRIAKLYGHAKQKGIVVGAALLYFLEADPETQGAYVERMATAEIRRGVSSLIAEAKDRQAQKIHARESHTSSDDEPVIAEIDMANNRIIHHPVRERGKK